MAMQHRWRRKKDLAEISWNLADFNKITTWWILRLLHNLFDRLLMFTCGGKWHIESKTRKELSALQKSNRSVKFSYKIVDGDW
jgi:hypothetical protein